MRKKTLTPPWGKEKGKENRAGKRTCLRWVPSMYTKTTASKGREKIFERKARSKGIRLLKVIFTKREGGGQEQKWGKGPIWHAADL